MHGRKNLCVALFQEVMQAQKDVRRREAMVYKAADEAPNCSSQQLRKFCRQEVLQHRHEITLIRRG